MNNCDKEKTGAPAFPWISTLSLLYPVTAAGYIATTTPAPLSMVVGYGVGNLAYVLLVAGIATGKFGAFGLKNRWQVFGLAVVCFALGVYLSSTSA